MRLCLRVQAYHGGCGALALQFQVELVDELGLGFEVGEQRAIWNTCLFRDSGSGGTKSLCDDDASCCLQDGNPLLVASRPGHGGIILESVWTVNYNPRSPFSLKSNKRPVADRQVVSRRARLSTMLSW